jgi:putative hydrolase of the HAD superfamily
MIKIKVAIFDLFKTLIDIQTDEGTPNAYAWLSNWLSYRGIYIDSQALQHAYRRLARSSIESNPQEYPDIDVGEVFTQLLKERPLPEKLNLETTVREVCLLFRILTTTSLTIYPQTIPTLNRLKEAQKVRLALASNTQRMFSIPEMKRFDLEKYFETILFSSDVKACKPNPVIFQRVLEILKVKPQEALYIGDNLFDDVWGAQRVGLQTLWIDREGTYSFPDWFQKPAPDYTIKGKDSDQLADLVLSLA